MVYTLASQFITSCPSGTPALPVKAATPLLSGGQPIVAAAAGSSVPLTFTKSSSTVAGPTQAVLYNGLGATLLPYTNGAITLPNNVQGFSYVILTNSATVAGVTSESFRS